MLDIFELQFSENHKKLKRKFINYRVNFNIKLAIRDFLVFYP